MMKGLKTVLKKCFEGKMDIAFMADGQRLDRLIEIFVKWRYIRWGDYGYINTRTASKKHAAH